MGLRYKPFATGGKPNASTFTVEGIVQQGITQARQRDRRALLSTLDTFGRQAKDNPAIQQMNLCQEQAYELILGDAGKVFDIHTEDEKLRERYGNTEFGASCLLARRLVEQGVKYVTINYNYSPNWDSHKKHFDVMKIRLPEFDKGFSTLLADLSDRGLLDRTIVWCGGEFGRGPKIQWEAPWNGGRSHHGKCFSHVVAGGGFQGGHVIGASDDKGIDVAERPVYPWDMIGSIYGQLGINPSARLPHPQGLDVRGLPHGSRRHHHWRTIEGNYVMKKACFLIIFLLSVHTAIAAEAPHLGYAYPAGGQQGTSFDLLLGGQYLAGATNVIVTGEGVRAEVLKHTVRYEQRELGQLFRQRENLEATIAQRKEKGEDYKKEQRRLDQLLHRLSLAELPDGIDISDKRQALRSYRSQTKEQFNPQLAERLRLHIRIAPNAEPRRTRTPRQHGGRSLQSPLF